MNVSVFMPPLARQSVEVQFIREPNVVRLARRLTREGFRHWRLPDEVSEAAELIVSELVTNAVTKAKGDTIQLRVRLEDRTGYLEVWDADPSPPLQREADESDTSGRGLFLVAAYSSGWGHYPSAGGKVVWARFRATSPHEFE